MLQVASGMTTLELIAHLSVLDNHLMGAAFIQSDKVDTVLGTKKKGMALLPAA